MRLSGRCGFSSVVVGAHLSRWRRRVAARRNRTGVARHIPAVCRAAVRCSRVGVVAVRSQATGCCSFVPPVFMVRGVGGADLFQNRRSCPGASQDRVLIELVESSRSVIDPRTSLVVFHADDFRVSWSGLPVSANSGKRCHHLGWAFLPGNHQALRPPRSRRMRQPQRCCFSGWSQGSVVSV